MIIYYLFIFFRIHMKNVTPASNWTNFHTSYYRYSYFVTHKLPTVSYRHCARSTDEVHKHHRPHAQWSSTFLKLHVTELPVTQQHNRTWSGWKKRNFDSFFFSFRLTTNNRHFCAFLKWKIMTQNCPGAACALC